jgi:hypothetical protein
MKILYFGNLYLDSDNLAVKVCKKLESEFSNIQFEHIKDTFSIIEKDLSSSLIIDVVQGLDKVRFIDPNQLQKGNISSLHDFDLGFLINLKRSSPKIIGIPQDYSSERAIEELRCLLSEKL